MTKEEAVNRFKGIKKSFSISIAQSKFYPSKVILDELCDMAIEALSADAITHEIRTETHECVSETHDLISRERTLRAINGYLETIPYIRNTLTDVGRRDATIHCLYIISELPSAEAVQGVGRYEKAMQKLREMPKYLHGIKEKQIKKIPPEAVEIVRCKECKHTSECQKIVQYTRNELNTVSIGYSPIEWCSRGERREP